MKLIVGLGNPGDQYATTRHNVGFQVVDKLRKELAFDEFQLKKKFDALISQGSINDEKVILAKPITFMNLSGRAVQQISKFYDIDLDDIWIIHDDLDFELGTMKIRKKGSGGSHNGVQSVIESLGSKDFARFRIGIESRTEKQKHEFAGKDYVLGRFKSSEKKIIEKVYEQCVLALKEAFTNGINEAMNKYN